MRFQHLLLLAGVTAGAAACNHDAGPFYPPDVPLAYIRWVNAVPDTGALDFRFVDQVENSPWYGELEFREMSNYQGAKAGARHIRVFPGGSNDIDVVSQIVLDTTLKLEAGKYYTILQTGYAREGSTPTQHFVVLEDPRPAPGGDEISIRAINTMIDSTLDVYVAPSTGTSPISGTPLFTGVGYPAASNYADTLTGKFAFQVASSGNTALLAQALAPEGHPPESSSQTAQGGYSIGGSLLTAFIFPPSVEGSEAPQSSKYQSAAVVWMQDNRPGS